jgi:DNA invertase Pin-like site-specific DNA recombinase
MVSRRKFVAYYRVMAARPGEAGIGIGGQRSAIAAYLKGRDWRIIGDFTEIETGKSANRPELERALAAARLHGALLLVSKAGRLTGSFVFLSRLLEAGVDVRFADLPQIEGPKGRIMLQQMVAVAAGKAGSKRAGSNQSVTATETMRKRAAEVRLRRAVFRAADIARIIAELRAAGATSLAEIAVGLNEKCIPTPRGTGAWSSVLVARQLQSGDRRAAIE